MKMDKRHRVIIPKKSEYLIGVDEAGRGALAGPVAVGAVGWSAQNQIKLRRALGDYPVGKDSKKLSPKQRDFWFARIVLLKQQGLLDYQVSLVGERMIDQKGISASVQRGINRNLAILNRRQVRLGRTCRILLDGGLVAPSTWPYQQTIIKGDEKELVIALASIVAKVTRDRLMTRLARCYPDYFLEIHKGYGTVRHYQALTRLGPTLIHRRSYLKGLVV